MNAKTLTVLRTAVTLIMLLALGMSFHHIADLAAIGGAGWERWVAAVLVDFVAILGKIGTNSAFNAKTRRTGKRTMIIAGSISMAANISVGAVSGSISGMIIGAGVIIVALWAESYLHGMNVKPSARKAAARQSVAVRATAGQATVTNLDGKTAAQQLAQQAEVKRLANERRQATRKANAARKAAEKAAEAPALAEDTRAYL